MSRDSPAISQVKPFLALIRENPRYLMGIQLAFLTTKRAANITYRIFSWELPPVFQLLHPYSNFLELIRIRHYITVTLQ